MRFFRVLGLVAAMVAGAVAPASAMTFKMATSGSSTVVVGSGEIRQGDARRLARALDRASRDRHGTAKLLLNSSGGQVAEALKMAAIIRQHGVTTIVQRGAICASACASVVFVAGKYRTVEDGGMLGIHSCYDSRNGRPATECNAVISAHAEQSGVPGDAMMALQEVAGSDTLIVFDSKEAACFGLTRQPGARVSRRTPSCVARMRAGN